ncbi:hypothetical protein LOC67_06435 [Stieleria sp. JC731]|uniref:hypothetical protein n=1 Tax=Pirellulaceae TaxID=2691357 RepID=UPI001E4B027B|nr:hypothetical protein [Stieleria sp. JC731]MCC9600191.1 hypothetical protein [Stieleria sp. JC731]
MAARFQLSGSSWKAVQELFEAGDPAFVDELCRCDNADALGSFANTWFSDRRPEARAFLSRYLDQPLSHFRHEALVKRLFKLAEKAGDDEVMAWMMVAFDRSIRRKLVKSYRYDWTTRESWEEETAAVPAGTEMPRDPRILKWKRSPRGRLPVLRLFSLKTRRYLQRRSWRYFRQLGLSDPVRYLKGVSYALCRYTDSDVADGLALIDNWGLVHVLFHDTDVLESSTAGWMLSRGRSLGDLAAAPAFANAWASDSQSLMNLLETSQCRPVRQWCIALIREHHESAMAAVEVSTLVRWVSGDSSELAEFAIELLQSSSQAGEINLDGWLDLLQQSNPVTTEGICRLAAKHVSADRLSIDQIVTVANHSSSLVASLAHRWLEKCQLTTREDCLAAFGVCESESETERSNLIKTVCAAVSKSPGFAPELAMEVLDSRHEEVRLQGWHWLRSDPRLFEATILWQRLIESPYDDIQMLLSELLEDQLSNASLRSRKSSGGLVSKNLDESDLRRLWATVLLNTRRGSRRKPGVMNQVIDQLIRSPDQYDQLEPILSIGIRSIRSTEWKATLAGLTRLIEARPEFKDKFESAFRELTFSA